MDSNTREPSHWDSTGSSVRYEIDAFAAPSLELPDLKEERIEFLGSGGFGEVWRVKYLGAEEAWKYIPLQKTSSEQIQRETWIARQISHPNVVRYLDLRQAGKFFVIREDLVRGRDLRQVVQEEGILSESLVLHIAVQVAEALTVAHRSGVIHQDLKPQNILLRNDDRTAMLTDFGLATLVSEEAIRGGTIHFMPPESFAEKIHPHPRQDIWSLGMTLYYLLAGRLPFALEGAEKEDLIRAIRTEEPIPLHDFACYVSDDLWAMITRMLSKDPGERPEDMSELLDELERISDRITCPDCGEGFSLSAVVGESCPNPDCGGAAIAAKRESLELFREGNTSFALAEYDQAKGYYKGVIALEEEGTPFFSDKARQLGDKAERAAQDLEDALADIQDKIENGKLQEAYDGCRTAFTSHGRSKTLAIALEGLLQRIRERYEGYEEKVDGLIKKAEFDQALEHLLEIRDFIRTQRLGAVLVGGERKDMRQRVRRALQDIKARKAKLDSGRIRFDKDMGNLQEKIANLDFEGARSVLVQLQVEFDAADKVSNLRDPLVRVAEKWRVVDQGVLARLGMYLSDQPAPGRKTPVRRTVGAVKEIVKELERPCFSSARIPLPEKLTSLLLDLENSLTSLEERFARYKQTAQEHLEAKDIQEAISYLGPLKTVALETDLVSREEADEVIQMADTYRSDLSRAEELYQAGRALFKECKYAEALTALETAFSLHPALNADLENDLQACRDRLAAVKERVDRLQEIRGRVETSVETGEAEGMDESGLERLSQNLETYFSILKELVELEGESASRVHLQETCAILERVLGLWGRAFSPRMGFTRRAGLLSRLLHVIQAVPYAVWIFLEDGHASEARLSFSSPVGHILKGYFAESGAQEDQDEEKHLAFLEGAMDRLEEMRRFLSVLVIRPNAEHPLATLAEAATRCARALPLNEQREAGLKRLQEVLRRGLALIGRGPLTAPLEAAAREVERELKRGMWSKTIKKSIRWGAWVAAGLLVAAAFWLGHRLGSAEENFPNELTRVTRESIESIERGDTGRLINQAGWLSSYEKQSVYIKGLDRDAVRREVDTKAERIVSMILRTELEGIETEIGSEPTTLVSLENELHRFKGRMALVIDCLRDRFGDLGETRLEPILIPLNNALMRVRDIQGADLGTAWKKYQTTEVSPWERKVFNAYLWLRSQAEILEAYGNLVRAVRDGEDNESLLTGRERLSNRLALGGEIYLTCRREEGGEAAWTPYLSRFTDASKEGGSFLEIFEKALTQ